MNFDYRIIALGVVFGSILDVVCKLAFSFVLVYKNLVLSPQWASVVLPWWLFRFTLQTVAAIVTGFAVAWWAREGKLRHAAIVGLLRPLLWTISTGLTSGIHAALMDLATWGLLLECVTSLFGALYGGYLAHSIQKNRGIKIN